MPRTLRLDDARPDRYQALPFDWDGTLVDSQEANRRAFNDAVAPHQATLDWFAAHTGLSTHDALAVFAQEHDVELDPDACSQARNEAFTDHLDLVRPIPRVHQLLVDWHHRMPCLVATGGASRTALATQRALGIDVLLHGTAAREDVVYGQPAPDVYLRAAELAGIPADACLALDDTDEGVAAALAAGMDVVDVRL